MSLLNGYIWWPLELYVQLDRVVLQRRLHAPYVDGSGPILQFVPRIRSRLKP
jgi:hypothetical protein